MQDCVVDARQVTKRFGTKVAVSDLSLSIGPGEIFGFLGPNGAGKTTAIKILLGLIAPDGGGATVLGAPVGNRQARARAAARVSLMLPCLGRSRRPATGWCLSRR